MADQIGGPGAYPPQPEGIYRFTQQVKYWKARSQQDRFRRGVYTFFWRSSPYPFLVTFDAPDANVACTRRSRSNTPLQALTLANDPAFVELANGLGQRIAAKSDTDDAARVDYGFRLCFSRTCNSVERERLLDYLRRDQPQTEDSKGETEWAALGRVLLNLDEFVTRE
jgi:hypothetical protein